MKVRSLLLASVATLGFAADAAFAQQVQQDPKAASQATRDADAGIEEIVVTAQRREEKSQSVPISISAFSKDVVREYMTEAQDIAKLTPNFQMTGGGSDGLTKSRNTIRGVGASGGGSIDLDSSGTLIYYDGIAAGASPTAAIPPWDIEQIEVLRGPQGTLFGRNAVGGLIHYISTAPTNELSGYGQVTLGQFNLRRVEGAIGGPLTDTLKVRLSFLGNERGGDTTNVYLDEDEGKKSWWGARGIIDWRPTDRLDVRIKAQHFKGGGDMRFLNSAPGALLAPNVRSFLGAIGQNPDLPVSTKFKKFQSGLSDSSDNNRYDFVEMDLNYDFGPVGFAGIVGFIDGDTKRLFDVVSSPAPMAISREHFTTRQWTAEARLTSQTESPFQWIVGGYYQHNDDALAVQGDQTALLRDLDGDGLTRWNANSSEDLFDGLLPTRRGVSTVATASHAAQELETYAFFLHTTHKWTDRLTTTHAVRYTHEAKKIDSIFNSLFEFPLSPGVAGGTSAELRDFLNFARLSPDQMRQQAVTVIADPNLRDASGNVIPRRDSASWNVLTWRFAVDYKITDSALLYASVSKGFKGGIFSAIPTTTLRQTADPERSVVYELGTKTQWLNNRLRINASTFYNDYRGFQTTLAVLTTSGFLSQVDNIPKSRIIGGELEVEVIPVKDLSISANAGIIDTKITRVTPGNESLLGNELPLAERWNFSGLARYDIHSNIGTFSPQVSWRYTGKFWSTKENNDITGKIGGFWTVDFRLSYESPSKNFYGLLYLKNAFNEVHPVRNSSQTAVLGSTVSFINERRNWGVTVGYRF